MILMTPPPNVDLTHLKNDSWQVINFQYFNIFINQTNVTQLLLKLAQSFYICLQLKKNLIFLIPGNEIFPIRHIGTYQ